MSTIGHGVETRATLLAIGVTLIALGAGESVWKVFAGAALLGIYSFLMESRQ